jgi:hypothetical protein
VTAALRALGEEDAAARLEALLAAGVELATALRGTTALCGM